MTSVEEIERVFESCGEDTLRDFVEILIAANRRLREALELICDLSKGKPRVIAIAALAAEPASGEANHCPDGRLCVCNKDGAGCMRADEAPPPPPTQGEEETALDCLVFYERPSKFALNSIETERRINAALRQRADEAREKVARWMIAHSYATGHGDTIEDLLVELAGEATRAENEACGALARAVANDGGADESEYRTAIRIADAIRARIKP